MDNTVKYIKQPKYIRQEPYVGDEGIWMPCQAYVQEGCACSYKMVMSKEMFIEAYNKWIKNADLLEG